MASHCELRSHTGRPDSGWKERRDARHPVLVRARMRAGGLPADVCIRDISVRGACIVSAAPPVRGTVVELTGSCTPIVGRVVWVTGQRFGIEVRGRINIPAFLSQQKPKQGGLPAPHELVAPPGTEGFARHLPRAPSETRQTGALMQFVFGAFLAGCAATFIAQTLYENLSSATAAIEAELQTGG